MQAKKFIEKLEQQSLLDPQLIAELRRQVNEARGRVTCEAIAKLLVENGQLTRFQATRIIAELKAADDTAAAAATQVNREQVTSSELDLAPEGHATKAKVGRAPKATVVEDPMIQAVEIIEPLEVIQPEIIEVEEVRPRERSRSASNRGAGGNSGARTAGKPKSAPPVRRLQTSLKPVAPVSGKATNPWDAFRIYGTGTILLALIVLFGFFGYRLMLGSANAAFESADVAYESRDYEAAGSRYDAFITNFPSDSRVGEARVRKTLSEIRNLSERLTDQTKAAAAATKAVPALVNDTAMSAAHRADLIGVLLSIADKIAAKAENAKEIEDKKGLIDVLDSHMSLLKNPQLVTSTELAQNDFKFKQLDEARDRIARDIERSQDLAVAVNKMAAALDEGLPNDAYLARRELIRRHPQLEIDPQITELVLRATSLQRGHVKSASAGPRVTTDDSVNATDKVTVLMNHKSVGTGNASGNVFMKVKGAVYGLQATDGKLLWRKYVGRNMQGQPERISNDAVSDVLLPFLEQGIIQRVAGASGQLIWQADFGRPLAPPWIDRDQVVVATKSGEIHCLSLENGSVRWSKQLPQSIVAGPGGAVGRNYVYILGDHSNLYVLSRQDGTCAEVFYTGHASGTVEVPPIYALGHLFVFENTASNLCNARVYKTDEAGLGIQVAQKEMTLRGHVVVPPQAEGRRVVAITDLGEVAALDIEPSNAREQVMRIATMVANETKPRSHWHLVDKNDLWIATNGLARYQIQVSQQKLNREWSKEALDEFVGRPLKLGSMIFHARVVRGTLGMRVTGADANSGQVVWEVDLGVPVAAITADASGQNLRALTTQGALYPIGQDGKALAFENPNTRERELRYRHPVRLADGSLVAINQEPSDKLIWFDARSNPNRVHQVALNLRGATMVTEPLAINNLLLLTLNNGQIATVQPRDGSYSGEPFQPMMKASDTIRWLQPTVLPDQQSIVAAHNGLRMYRWSLDRQRSAVEAPLDDALRGSLASTQQNVFGVMGGSASDSVCIYDAADLKLVHKIPLQGHVVWGPYGLGDRAYLISDAEGVVSLDGQDIIEWKQAVPRLPWKGEPQKLGNDLLITATNGLVLRLAATDGSVVARLETAEPLAGPPLQIGDELLLPGDEGVVIHARFGPRATEANL